MNQRLDDLQLSRFAESSLPADHPGYNRVITDSEGRLWVILPDGTKKRGDITDSSAVILAQAGDNLLTKYTAAKALTPNGSAKSATNRATLLIMPGTYALSGTLSLNADFVDVIGLGAQTQKPAVLLTGYSISCTNTTNKDYRVSGISVGTTFGFTGHSVAADDKRVIENCAGISYSFGSGVAASGTFKNCTGGSYSFGSGGTASGTFENCTGGSYSFGGNGTADGTFINCTGGNNSFCGGGGGTASGTFENCTGGISSFGGGGGAITANARILRCRLTSGAFNESPAAGAIIRLSLDGTDTEVNVGP